MNQERIIQELQFKAVRSSGAGGQHVNKVSTKIELYFDVENSKALSSMEKERVYRKLSNKISKEHTLIIQCDESRSQHRNKDLAIKRLLQTLTAALKRPKKRHKTKPRRSAIEKRLKRKKINALKKINRGKPNLD